MAADEIKKCSVRIGGVYYQLVTAENEQYTRKIAARADEMINRFLQDNPQLSQTMATVLSLVNAVDELSRAYQQLKGMEGQHLDLDNKASEARRELSRLREQHWEMKKELLRITDLNRDYQTLINKLTQAEAQKVPAIPVEEPESFVKVPAIPVEEPEPFVEEEPESSDEEQTTSSAEEESLPAEEETASSDKEQPVSLDEEQPSPPDDKQSAVTLLSDSTAEPQDLADLETNQSVPAADQPDAASEMESEEEEEKEEQTEEQTPEPIPIVDPPTDLPEPSRRTIDRLQQTNLDDYLHAFGLNEKSRDTAQSDR